MSKRYFEYLEGLSQVTRIVVLVYVASSAQRPSKGAEIRLHVASGNALCVFRADTFLRTVVDVDGTSAVLTVVGCANDEV